jgi:hypothetical protein
MDFNIDVYKQTDVVLINDDKIFLNHFAKSVAPGKKIDTYSDPFIFMSNLSKYKKDIFIILVNQFSTVNTTGIALAKKLYEQGYTNIYLMSGSKFRIKDYPNYLTPILKGSLDTVGQIFKQVH